MELMAKKIGEMIHEASSRSSCRHSRNEFRRVKEKPELGMISVVDLSNRNYLAFFPNFQNIIQSDESLGFVRSEDSRPMNRRIVGNTETYTSEKHGIKLIITTDQYGYEIFRICNISVRLRYIPNL